MQFKTALYGTSLKRDDLVNRASRLFFLRPHRFAAYFLPFYQLMAHFPQWQTKSEENIMARVELNKQAPEFSSLDLNGTSVSLSNFANRMNVLLVFNRSFS